MKGFCGGVLFTLFLLGCLPFRGECGSAYRPNGVKGRFLFENAYPNPLAVEESPKPGESPMVSKSPVPSLAIGLTQKPAVAAAAKKSYRAYLILGGCILLILILLGLAVSGLRKKRLDG